MTPRFVLFFMPQVCKGRVDHYVAPYLQLVLTKLVTTKNRTLKVQGVHPFMSSCVSMHM